MTSAKLWVFPKQSGRVLEGSGCGTQAADKRPEVGETVRCPKRGMIGWA